MILLIKTNRNNKQNLNDSFLMKKIFMILLMAAITIGAKAQFEKGTHFVNASLTGLGIGFTKGNFTMGVSGEYGYFVDNGLMIGGSLGYTHQGGLNSFHVKPTVRYSFQENGLNLGCGVQFEHAGTSANYIQLSPQVGYTFYLSNKVSIEPAIYADFALNDFKNGTNAGLKIGIGLYRK